MATEHPLQTTIKQAQDQLAGLDQALTAALDALSGSSGWWRRSASHGQESIPQVRERIQDLRQELTRLQQEFASLEQERQRLDTLCGVSQVINSTLNLEELLNLVMDMIIQVTRAERGFLMLLEGDPAASLAEALQVRVARNMDQETIAGSDFSRSIITQVVQEGRPVLTTDAQADPRFSDQASVIGFNLRSILCVPLLVKDKSTGVVYVDNRIKTGLFAQEDLDLLAAFANQAAIALENARLFESLRQKVIEITTMKDYMDNVFASVASGVVSTDVEGRITTFNRAAETIFALPADRALGQPYRAVLGAIEDPELPGLVEEVRRGAHEYIPYELEANVPGRGHANLRLHLSGLRDANGDIMGTTIVVDDLTVRRQLEAERRREEQEKHRIKELFQRYVAPTVVNRLLSDPRQVALGGERREVTVLFADIRGYTPLAEHMAPEELVALLNEYLALMSEAIFRYEGTLDKFMGDAVLAFFNAPEPQPDHALRAVRAAQAMQNAILTHRQRYPQEKPISYGIGINTGEVVVGNIGAQVMNYTVIGDAVNVAQRLQAGANPGQILLSDSTYQLVRDHVDATTLGPMPVKGRSEPVHVYTLVTITEAR
jgi:PAS domain S-box-containing protein